MPHQPYFVDGERVASVTTILARWKESGGLIHWAWDQGRKGLDFRETRDRAADAGSLCHAMVDCDIRGTPVSPDGYKEEDIRKAKHAFRAYEEWKSHSQMRALKTELPLVSKKHKFGGCLDTILVRNSLRLGDWKTSNGVYTEMLIQVAGGYSLLWEENYPDQPIEGVEILRFSKPEHQDDPISFHHHYWSAEVIPLAQRQFLLLKEAYDLDKRLKALI